MEFFVSRAQDGLRLIGLYSRAADARSTVVHIHGFGGDFFSNQFVRDCHLDFPRAGISFLSFGLRTMGYVTEVYSEDSVVYVGASLANQTDALLDIEAAIADLGVPKREIVLQGHSFGTNLVKSYARSHPEIRRAVFISPADSVHLYRSWRDSQPPKRVGSEGGRTIRWDLFGMAAGNARYPLPMSRECRDSLAECPVFREWSLSSGPTHQEALVIQGEDDPIGLTGTTGDPECIRRLLPNASVVRIPGAGHLLSGHETQLLHTVESWVLGQQLGTEVGR